MYKTNFISFVSFVSFVFFICLACHHSRQVRNDTNERFLPFRPNILWLVAEDLSPVLPPFGDSTIITPTLSRLAAEGIRYPNVFSPSGVCAPSRAALALGMYPARVGAHHMRNGFWASGRPSVAMMEAQRKFFPPGLPYYESMPPKDARMHSEYLRRSGYYCSNRFKQDYQFVAPVTAWDDCSPTAHWKGRQPGQPFFAIFNFEVTHESQVWGKTKDSLWIDSTLSVPVPTYLPTTPKALKDIRRMYSNVMVMDSQIENIIAELEKEGLLDSTIIFWYADHGGPLPRQKRLCYDSGLRAPLIIRYPNQWQANQVDSQLISFVDFLPSLMSLAHIKPTKLTDGRAFAGPYASDKRRQYIHGGADRFDEQYDMIRAVRDHRFKYLRNYEMNKPYYLPVAYREQMPIMQELLRLRGDQALNEYQAQWFRLTKEKEELFDTYLDPFELKNLAADPAYQDKLRALSKECDRWMQEIQDKGLIPEKEYVHSIWKGDLQPLTQIPEIQVNGNTLSFTCETKGASIGYKIISGSVEPKSWAIYQRPFNLKSTDKLKVVAHRIGFLPSSIFEYPK